VTTSDFRLLDAGPLLLSLLRNPVHAASAEEGLFSMDLSLLLGTMDGDREAAWDDISKKIDSLRDSPALWMPTGSSPAAPTTEWNEVFEVSHCDVSSIRFWLNIRRFVARSASGRATDQAADV
jgi:hypothetical protein